MVVFLNRLILFLGVNERGISCFVLFFEVSLIFCKVVVGVNVIVFEGERVLFVNVFYCE